MMKSLQTVPALVVVFEEIVAHPSSLKSSNRATLGDAEIFRQLLIELSYLIDDHSIMQVCSIRPWPTLRYRASFNRYAVVNLEKKAYAKA